MSLQRQHILLSYFKTLSVGPECWSAALWLRGGTRDPFPNSCWYLKNLFGGQQNLLLKIQEELALKNNNKSTHYKSKFMHIFD